MAIYSNNNQSIKNWAEDDRPREKLVMKGKASLSDAELLAIIMGSGNRDESAVELAQRILRSSMNNWNELARLNITDLCQFKGIGQAKAVSIIACLEIGRRRQTQDVLEKPKITSSADAAVFFQQKLGDLAVEEFWVMYLNQSNSIIKVEQISQGGISQTTVDIRVILKKGLEVMATALLLAHNHPSGSLIPSEADKQITRKIKEAAKMIDILLLDHLIVTQKAYYSFSDHETL